MPKQDPGEMGDLAKMLIDEMNSDASHIADAMFGEIATVDGVALNKTESADYIKNGWLDPKNGAKFRADLLEQVGPRNFWQMSHGAFGLKAPKVTQQMHDLFMQEPSGPMAPVPLDAKPLPSPFPVPQPPMPQQMGGGVAPLSFPPPGQGAPNVTG